MTREIQNLLTPLSLLLCLAAAGLWARNLWVSDHLHHVRFDSRGDRVGDVSLYSFWGSVVVHVGRLDQPVPEPGGAAAVPFVRHGRWFADSGMPPYDAGALRVVAGFGGGAYRYAYQPSAGGGIAAGGTAWVVMVPWYAIILATAVAPAVWAIRRWKRRADERAGRCVKCGYDLRASPGRCPECGAAGGA